MSLRSSLREFYTKYWTNFHN